MVNYVTNDMQLKALKVPEGQKQTRNPVGGGLYLLIRPTSKSWRWDFRLAGKRDTFSIGAYPDVSLKQARQRLAEAKALQQKGINPRVHQQQEKAANIAAQQAVKAQQIEDANTFNAAAQSWLAKQEIEWSPSHYAKQNSRLRNHILPAMGDLPIKQITRQQVTALLQVIVDNGTRETAKRCGLIISGVFDYALNAGLVYAIPLGNLNKVLPAPQHRKMPALTDSKEVGGLLRAIDGFQGDIVTRYALKILPHVVLRAGEFRLAEWTEINLKKQEWIVPASHRKLKRALQMDDVNVHVVPLSTQATALLTELWRYTGHGKYLFPSTRAGRSMSENTINGALHALGYKNRMVGHGWRSVFSTWGNASGFNPDAIERQLAHTEKNAVRAAYNRGEYIDERTRMMQAWADYLDGLRTGADVIPIKRKA